MRFDAKKQVRPRGQRAIYPRTLERDYARAIKRRLRAAARALRAELEALAKFRTDSTAGDERAAVNAIGSVKLAYYETYTELVTERLTLETAGKAEAYMDRQFTRQVNSVLGVDPMPTPALRSAALRFAQENVALIRSVEEEYFARLEADIVLALRQGARWEQLAPIISERYKVSGRRAELIARDQMGSLVSQVAQAKQQSAGFDKYIWRNSQDERVVGNPSGLYPQGNDRHGDHWSREGKVFSWSNPPHDGHPGEAINCRCTAEPYWGDEEAEEADESDLVLAPKGGVLEEGVRQAKSLLEKAREESEKDGDWERRFRDLISRDEPTTFDRLIPRPSVREIADALDRPEAPPKAREAIRLLRDQKVGIRYYSDEKFDLLAKDFGITSDTRGFTDGDTIFVRSSTEGKLTLIAHELSHVVDMQLGVDYSLREEEAAAWLFESDIRRLYGQEPIVITRKEAFEIYDRLYDED